MLCGVSVYESVFFFSNDISTLLFPPLLPFISPHVAVFFWSHAEQGSSVHHRKCGGEWPRPDARLPQSCACWPRLPPTPRPCSGLLWTALKTKKHLPCLNNTQTYQDFDKDPNTHLHTKRSIYICSHTRTYMIIATEAQIFRYRETHFYMKHTHTASSFHISCCHWLILQKTDEYNCGANGVETEQWTTMASHLPAAFFSF